VILEVAIMKIKPDLIAEFEAVFPQAAAVSASTPGYISHEMQRCVETKGKYFYLIRWESIEAHEVNFRQSPRRAQFRDLLVKFWEEPPFAEHLRRLPATESSRQSLAPWVPRFLPPPVPASGRAACG